MADASPSQPIAQNSDSLTTITLTSDQRAALTSLLVNAIMDTGSNRAAGLYRAILTEISQLSSPVIEITEPMAFAGAKALAAALHMAWDGLHPGTVDPRYPAWEHGGHSNARQGDYAALSRAIISAGLAARAGS